ncbi:MAG: GNAT family N-acetyltransferase [Muribaculaceae bacterium]|nr:GNAT family N-acetyltransferase [Muribaculaceae bacterium]
MESIRIRKAIPEDAPAIARGIIMAVGEEIATEFAGSPERLPLVEKVFTDLARREDSQYSYRNSLVAETESGDIAGIIVAYDGARLHDLRPAFCEEAAATLGINIKSEDMHDETSPDEIYLDSLAVFPPYRRHGLGRRLIAAAIYEHKSSGKPIGLLCDPPNKKARRLYESLGFKPAGQRPFADTMMDHLVISC